MERIKCPAIILIIKRNPRVSGRELIVTISTKKRKGTKNIGANLGTNLVKFWFELTRCPETHKEPHIKKARAGPKLK
jgi:hypothetical protein